MGGELDFKCVPGDLILVRTRAMRKGESPLTRVAKDFGISESCLHRWMKQADIEDGVRPGVTNAESAELRELKKRNRVLEQENEILRRAAAFFAREALPK